METDVTQLHLKDGDIIHAKYTGLFQVGPKEWQVSLGNKTFNIEGTKLPLAYLVNDGVIVSGLPEHHAVKTEGIIIAVAQSMCTAYVMHDERGEDLLRNVLEAVSVAIVLDLLGDSDVISIHVSSPPMLLRKLQDNLIMHVLKDHSASLMYRFIGNSEIQAINQNPILSALNAVPQLRQFGDKLKQCLDAPVQSKKTLGHMLHFLDRIRCSQPECTDNLPLHLRLNTNATWSSGDSVHIALLAKNQDQYEKIHNEDNDDNEESRSDTSSEEDHDEAEIRDEDDSLSQDVEGSEQDSDSYRLSHDDLEIENMSDLEADNRIHVWKNVDQVHRVRLLVDRLLFIFRNLFHASCDIEIMTSAACIMNLVSVVPNCKQSLDALRKQRANIVVTLIAQLSPWLVVRENNEVNMFQKVNKAVHEVSTELLLFDRLIQDENLSAVCMALVIGLVHRHLPIDPAEFILPHRTSFQSKMTLRDLLRYNRVISHLIATGEAI